MSCYQFLAIVWLPEMVVKKFKDVLLLKLVSCLLSGENESRTLANTGKLALFSQKQASSDPVLFSCSQVSLYHLRFLAVISPKNNFSFQYTGPFYDSGQLENAVVKLT